MKVEGDIRNQDVRAGSTLSECAATLRAAGATPALVLTLARG